MRLKTVLLLLIVSSASGNTNTGVNIRNIDDDCVSKNPLHPVTLGTHLPSLILQKRKGAYKQPCLAVQDVFTESQLTTLSKLYVKVVALNLPKTADGKCYHALRMQGLVDEPEHAVTLCGKLEDLPKTDFVSLQHDIEVAWNALEHSDPVLNTEGFYHGFLKVVITAFTEASPVLGCPNEADPRKPESMFTYHQCSNGRCIDERLRCNNFNNCGDEEASDEEGCSTENNGKLFYIVSGVVAAVVSLTILLIFCLLGPEHDELDVESDEESVITPIAGAGAGASAEQAGQTIENPESANVPPTATNKLETIDEETQDSA